MTPWRSLPLQELQRFYLSVTIIVAASLVALHRPRWKPPKQVSGEEFRIADKGQRSNRKVAMDKREKIKLKGNIFHGNGQREICQAGTFRVKAEGKGNCQKEQETRPHITNKLPKTQNFSIKIPEQKSEEDIQRQDLISTFADFRTSTRWAPAIKVVFQ